MSFFCDSEVYKKSYTEASEVNRDTINQINDFKRELDAVRVNLKENQKNLHLNVIVPLSSKAMVRGKLVHTNEIFVDLGARWFLRASSEKALEICERMIERCNTNICQWEKETSLLNSNLGILDEIGVFPTETLKEIIEPYDEAYETRWREQHKERVREHKKQEMINRLTDEELLQRLDRLEVEEATMRTMDKVDSNEELLDLVHMCRSSVHLADLKITDNVPLCTGTIKEVSSCNENADVCQETRENWHGISVVHFKHSDRIPKFSKKRSNEEIVSPNDVYRLFLHQLPPTPVITNPARLYHNAKSKMKETANNYLS